MSHMLQEGRKDDEYDDHIQESEFMEAALIDSPSVHRVCIALSPQLHVYYKQLPIMLTLDIGATAKLMKASFASYNNFPTSPASDCPSD